MARILGSDLGATVLNQDIYEISATQKHRLGTRVVRGDKTYHYAKTLTSITNSQLAVWSYYHQEIMYAAIAAASPVGANYLYVTVGAADGIANDGVIAAHALEGGSVVLFDASTDEWLNYTIRDNNAAVSGGTITLTIEGTLPYATTTSDHVEVMASPWLVSSGNNGGLRPFWGPPMRLATTTYPYFWIQTWGPCWLAPQASVGATAHKNEVVFRHDGSIDLPVYNDSYTMNAQRAGFVMTRAQAGTQGAPFIFLQVAA